MRNSSFSPNPIHVVLFLILALFATDTAFFSLSKAALWNKRYIVKKDGGKKILCDPYVVQKGDWVFKIFRQKGEISEKDYPAFITIFKNINPQVGDIDQIYPGDMVLIPLKIITRDTLPSEHTESAVIPFASISDTPIETIEIRKGDTISELIVQHFGSQDSKAYEEALNRFKKLNPKIEDPDQIVVGQKIHVPALKKVPLEKATTIIGDTPQSGHASILMQKDKSNHQSYFETEDTYIEPILSPPKIPKVDDQLRQIAMLLEATLFDKGSYHFPVKGKNDLRLDLGLFPVLRLKNNTRIIFLRPFSKALSELSTIRSQWEPVFFVRIPASPVSIYYLLDKIIGVVNLNRPRKMVTFKDGGIKTTVRSKWILQLEELPGQPHRYICLTPVDQKEGPFPETIFNYLTNHRITYWGVKPDGRIAETRSRPADHTTVIRRPIPISEPRTFIRRTLPALGWRYKEDVKISFPFAGIQVNAISNMLTVDAKRNCLIDFGSFAGESIAAIETTGLKVISLKDPFDPLTYMRTILMKLSHGYTQNPTIFVQNLKDEQGVSFTYPGLMIPQRDGQTLITSAFLTDEMKQFLESRGTQIINVAP